MKHWSLPIMLLENLGHFHAFLLRHSTKIGNKSDQIAENSSIFKFLSLNFYRKNLTSVSYAKWEKAIEWGLPLNLYKIGIFFWFIPLWSNSRGHETSISKIRWQKKVIEKHGRRNEKLLYHRRESLIDAIHYLWSKLVT